MTKEISEDRITEKIADITLSVMRLNFESELCFFMYVIPHTQSIRVVCSKSKEEYNDFLWDKEIYYSIDPKNDIDLETNDVMHELESLEKKLDENLKQTRRTK